MQSLHVVEEVEASVGFCRLIVVTYQSRLVILTSGEARLNIHILAYREIILAYRGKTPYCKGKHTGLWGENTGLQE